MTEPTDQDIQDWLDVLLETMSQNADPGITSNVVRRVILWADDRRKGRLGLDVLTRDELTSVFWALYRYGERYISPAPIGW